MASETNLNRLVLNELPHEVSGGIRLRGSELGPYRLTTVWVFSKCGASANRLYTSACSPAPLTSPLHFEGENTIKTVISSSETGVLCQFFDSFWQHSTHDQALLAKAIPLYMLSFWPAFHQVFFDFAWVSH